MKRRPDLHDFVRHKISGMNAQVWQHYTDRPDMVGVIILPQPGANSSDIYKRWHVDDIDSVPNMELSSGAKKN